MANNEPSTAVNCTNPNCKCEKGQCMCCVSVHWHEGHNSLLQHWRKQASINLWLQIASNYYYVRINDWLSYPSILLSATLSISVFGLGSGKVGQFVSAIIAMLAGILVAVNKHLGSQTKAQAHMLRAKDYYGFVRYLDCLLSTAFEERDPMTETMQRIKDNFNRIVDMSLEPPLHVVRSYEKRFKPIENILFTPNISQIDKKPTLDLSPRLAATSSGPPPRISFEKASNISDATFQMKSIYFPAKTTDSSSSDANVMKQLSHRNYVKFLMTPQQLTSVPIISPPSLSSSTSHVKLKCTNQTFVTSD